VAGDFSSEARGFGSAMQVCEAPQRQFRRRWAPLARVVRCVIALSGDHRSLATDLPSCLAEMRGPSSTLYQPPSW